MTIAEKLYTQGLISYPRTETNIFPKDFNLAALIENQTNDPNWGGIVSFLLLAATFERRGRYDMYVALSFRVCRRSAAKRSTDSAQRLQDRSSPSPHPSDKALDQSECECYPYPLLFFALSILHIVFWSNHFKKGQREARL